MQRHSVNQAVPQTFMITCEEDTVSLAQTLEQEGLNYRILRQAALDPTVNYARSYLCLMNHCRAWEAVVAAGEPGLVIEADFIPVKGFGALPIPCDLSAKTTGIAWLYTCASQIYSVTEQGYAEGFSVSTVAYLVTPAAAAVLLEFAGQVRSQWGETRYSPWDSQIEEVLRKQGFTNYIPFRNYGEHGGIPNPEHLQNRHQWKQIKQGHRADRLYGELAFLPGYAKNHWEFLQVRTYARVKGLLRLLTGRLLRWAIVRRSSVPWRLIRFALRQQLLW
jgi:hypothetical protein